MRVERSRRLVVVLAGIASLLIGAVSLFVWSVAASGSDVDDLLPNLTQAAPGDLSGRTGGTPASPRFFLGFESAAANLGTGPLVVLGRRTGEAQEKMRLRQQITRSDGSTRAVSIPALLEYVRSSDHSHWHLLGFMRYELHTAGGALILRDRKTGFCLGDRYRVELALPGRALSSRFSDRCGKGMPRLLTIREGISVGWGDDYAAHLEGQEFEVTTLAPGRYVLVHRVNPSRQLRERDYSDNSASMAIELTWPRGRKLSPRIDVVERCPGTAVCP